MRILTLTAMLLSSALPAAAGPIATEFDRGVGGIGWLTPLSEIIERFPGGAHLVSTSPGCRAYVVNIEDTLFGIERPGFTVQYFIGARGLVDSIAIAFPWGRRDELVRTLIGRFGPYLRRTDIGKQTYYDWKEDAGMNLRVFEMQDPTVGILEVAILGPEHAKSRPCPTKVTGQLTNDWNVR